MDSHIISQPGPGPVKIIGEDHRVLFQINPDGTVEGEVADASEAARIFAREVNILLSTAGHPDNGRTEQLELMERCITKAAKDAALAVREEVNGRLAEAQQKRAEAESALNRLAANIESLTDEQWMNPVNYSGPVADVLRTMQRRVLLILKDALA